jgi:hypothetical protein
MIGELILKNAKIAAAVGGMRPGSLSFFVQCCEWTAAIL